MRWHSTKKLETLRTALLSREPVTGLTHEFYRYPGRFSPEFARAAIETFTAPGDVVFDPFMGGGTTLVEALATGRKAIGLDISSLAEFVATTKTSFLRDDELDNVKVWLSAAIRSTSDSRTDSVADVAAQRNLGTAETWRLRNWIAQCLAQLSNLTPDEQRFTRAVILRVAQWALDCRSEIPSLTNIRKRMVRIGGEMCDSLRHLRDSSPHQSGDSVRTVVRSAAGCENDPRTLAFGRARLVVTSPPYPGVHVLYNRWQIMGRKETPAPFWIANVQDGHGLSYYTFADRRADLRTYFDRVTETFRSISAMLESDGLIVQLVGFSRPTEQLPSYLIALRAAGLKEIFYRSVATGDDGRLWRAVPNRKWYADRLGASGASNEVVLFHRVPSPRRGSFTQVQKVR